MSDEKETIEKLTESITPEVMEEILSEKEKQIKIHSTVIEAAEYVCKLFKERQFHSVDIERGEVAIQISQEAYPEISLNNLGSELVIYLSDILDKRIVTSWHMNEDKSIKVIFRLNKYAM